MQPTEATTEPIVVPTLLGITAALFAIELFWIDFTDIPVWWPSARFADFESLESGWSDEDIR